MVENCTGLNDMMTSPKINKNGKKKKKKKKKESNQPRSYTIFIEYNTIQKQQPKKEKKNQKNKSRVGI